MAKVITMEDGKAAIEKRKDELFAQFDKEIKESEAASARFDLKMANEPEKMTIDNPEAVREAEEAVIAELFTAPKTLAKIEQLCHSTKDGASDFIDMFN